MLRGANFLTMQRQRNFRKGFEEPKVLPSTGARKNGNRKKAAAMNDPSANAANRGAATANMSAADAGAGTYTANNMGAHGNFGGKLNHSNGFTKQWTNAEVPPFAGDRSNLRDTADGGSGQNSINAYGSMNDGASTYAVQSNGFRNGAVHNNLSNCNASGAGGPRRDFADANIFNGRRIHKDFANPNIFGNRYDRTQFGGSNMASNANASNFVNTVTFSNSSTSETSANSNYVQNGAQIPKRKHFKGNRGPKHLQYNNEPTTQSPLRMALPVTTSVPPPIYVAENPMSGLDFTQPPPPVLACAMMPKNTTIAPSSEAAVAPGSEASDCDIEHLFKHPLQHEWTLWYLENDRSKSWEDMQHVVISFDTVEDFWSIYNHTKRPSELNVGCDYSLFKRGIRPMWEDVQNKLGGRWIITVPRNSREDNDEVWLDVLLTLIGEACDFASEICGAVINVRAKSSKISIWTRDGYNKKAALEIGNKLRELCQLERQCMQYQLHKDTMHQHCSSVKSLYTL